MAAFAVSPSPIMAPARWAICDSSLPLRFAYYDFCRTHSTIKTSQAVVTGGTDLKWKVVKLLERVAGS